LPLHLKTVQFELEFGKGICRGAELIDLGVKHKLISKAGAFYNFNGQNFHGKDAFKKFLAENESVRDELTVKLRQQMEIVEKKSIHPILLMRK
jgi:recombination protein RecA